MLQRVDLAETAVLDDRVEDRRALPRFGMTDKQQFFLPIVEGFTAEAFALDVRIPRGGVYYLDFKGQA